MIASTLVLFIRRVVGSAAERAEAMLQRRDRRIALNATMTEAGCHSESSKKHVYATKLDEGALPGVQHCGQNFSAPVSSTDIPFSRRYQMSLRNIEGIGQPTLRLLLEHRSVAAFNLADALGMDAGLLGDGLLTHPEC